MILNLSGLHATGLRVIKVYVWKRTKQNSTRDR